MAAHDQPERRQSKILTFFKRAVKAAPRTARGQSMVEYALIAVLVCIGIAVIITATGPTIGNVFYNTIDNLMGGQLTYTPALSGDQLNTMANKIASISPPPPTYLTNTPLVPTCSAGSRLGTWAMTITSNPPNSANGYGTWVPGVVSCP